METIKKIISLEDYKNRFNYTNACLFEIKNDNTVNNWGKIPMDCYFSNKDDCAFYEIKNNIPFNDGIIINDKNEFNIVNDVLRYKNIIHWYNWLNEYGKKCNYYKLCKQNDILKWVYLNADFFDINYGLYNENETIIRSLKFLPSANEEYKIGDIVEINDNADLFNTIFRLNGDSKRYEILFLDFIKEYFYGNKNDIAISIPYIDIPLYLTQKIDNLGLLSNNAEEWDPRKKYVVGDTVIFNKNLYVLKKGDAYELMEMTGGLFDMFKKKYDDFNDGENDLYYVFVENLPVENDEINTIIYDAETLKRNIFFIVTENDIKFYYPYLIHKAKKNDENNEFIFDETLWEKSIKNDDESSLTKSGIVLGKLFEENNDKQYILTSKAESKLSQLKRYKKTIDNEGNVLSFIINENGSTDTELPFKMGRTNINIDSHDNIYVDIINSIKIENNDNSESLILNYNTKNNRVKIIKIFTSKNVDIYDNTIKLNENITLQNIEENNIIYYDWIEKYRNKNYDETIEIVKELPEAKEENLDAFLQISSSTNNIITYTIYKCEKTQIKLFYSGVCENNISVTPSLMEFNDAEFLKNNGVITFEYIKDCLIDDKNMVDPNSGVYYNDSYLYEIKNVFLNYTSPEKIELEKPHKYELCDYEPNENDIILYDYNNVINGIFTHKNVGDIYAQYDENDKINGYLRVLSEYKTFDIKYKDAIVEIKSSEIENLSKNVILSNINYGLKQITNDDFQNDYVYKNEFLIGVEDVIENADINIERGTSSSFERHHILSEIKSLKDLENYRNNFFEL